MKSYQQPLSEMTRGKRHIDVDGNVNIPDNRPRPRARTREGLKCTWREACKAADYVLEHFGDKLLEAEMRLVDAGRRFLIPVLLLIVENVDNREESLKRVSKRTYFRHRNALLRFFSKPQP